MTLLAKRYATALHGLAAAAHAVDAVAADLAALHAALDSAAARSLLTSPDLGSRARDQVLAKLGAGRHALVQNLLGVLQRRRRLEVLFDLHPQFLALLQAERGEVSGEVATPHPLGAAEMAALTGLAARLSGKKVTLTQVLAPELLGGVRLRLGNVLYDGSVLASLQQMQDRLLQASI
jgi:F-type H+-transporting ATPase subunit delta